MTDAPERIWANVDPYSGRFLGLATVERTLIYKQAEFVRADLHEALAAENARLREALANIAVMGYSDDPAVNANIARMAVDQARKARAAGGEA